VKKVLEIREEEGKMGREWERRKESGGGGEERKGELIKPNRIKIVDFCTAARSTWW